MANKSKNQVIDELTLAGIATEGITDYKVLCEMLRDATEVEVEASPVVVTIVNRVRKRNVFLADSVRDENDKRFLHKEIGKKIYKGKINTITTIKHCQVSDEGEWVTEFDIELKE